MTDTSDHDEAVRLLQEFGLREYESRAFVALTRLPQGTAKEISDISDVPRTRVYDAVRILESKGLVEIQHSNPQQFRAVPVKEATATLQQEYEARTESLRDTLNTLSMAPANVRGDTAHEVWALSGSSAITSRTQELIREAENEVVLVLGAESFLTGALLTDLRAAAGSGTGIIVGTTAEKVRRQVQKELPEAEVFVSGLDWLSGTDIAGDDTDISRLLLTDRSAILVSTFQSGGDIKRGHEHERAVFGRGFDNGLVTVARRLMATGSPISGDGS